MRVEPPRRLNRLGRVLRIGGGGVADDAGVVIGEWHEVWATVHDDGSLTLATPIGGHRASWEVDAAGNECRAEYLETFTVDLMVLVKLASGLRGTDEYELQIGIEWGGADALIFEQATTNSLTTDRLTGYPIVKFAPVATTVRPVSDDENYLGQVRDLAQDLINQAGLQHVRLLSDEA